MTRDTIFALASANGKAGVAVYRVSGPDADGILIRICGHPLPDTRRAVWRRFIDSKGQEIDDGIVIRFADGASFTGEPTVEFHGHGGTASIKAMIDALASIEGARLAEPGEFSRRAFLNGRFSLVEADALADLIDAETDLQRAHALQRKSGALRRLAESWRERIVDARALLELTIDWVDEDVPVSVDEEVSEKLSEVRDEISAELLKGRRSSRLDTGFEVALVGPPNVGKSSLINYLTQRQSAIVSPFPGTTRDIIEAPLDFDGVPVRLLDMAGIRSTDDPIEKIGVDLAVSRAQHADLRLFLVEPGTDQMVNGEFLKDSDIIVSTKSDLHTSREGMSISTVTGEGIEALIGAIRERLPNSVDSIGGFGTARELGLAQSCLDLLEESLLDDRDIEVRCQSLMSAQSKLDDLLGYSGIEAVFDSVFSRFCLGK